MCNKIGNCERKPEPEVDSMVTNGDMTFVACRVECDRRPRVQGVGHG